MTRRRLLVPVAGLLPTIFVAVLSVYRAPFLTNLEYGVYDTLLRSVPAQPPDGQHPLERARRTERDECA